MAYSYAELQRLSDDELVRAHDEAAKTTVIGVSYFLEELSRRRFERLHRSIIFLTKVILALTVLNTIFVGVAVFRR
ncbi:MAG: hypothetical protein DMD45_14505 [Gemmatimonadetes bacterium]|nr:MAG: hypothetical protein DMD45_14505 [Gemmatimonadota bacterium]